MSFADLVASQQQAREAPSGIERRNAREAQLAQENFGIIRAQTPMASAGGRGPDNFAVPSFSGTTTETLSGPRMDFSGSTATLTEPRRPLETPRTIPDRPGTLPSPSVTIPASVGAPRGDPLLAGATTDRELGMAGTRANAAAQSLSQQTQFMAVHGGDIISLDPVNAPDPTPMEDEQPAPTSGPVFASQDLIRETGTVEPETTVAPSIPVDSTVVDKPGVIQDTEIGVAPTQQEIGQMPSESAVVTPETASIISTSVGMINPVAGFALGTSQIIRDVEGIAEKNKSFTEKPATPPPTATPSAPTTTAPSSDASASTGVDATKAKPEGGEGGDGLGMGLVLIAGLAVLAMAVI